MKLVFSAPGLPRQWRQIFNQKIIARYAGVRRKGQRRDRIEIAKSGRLVSVEFACSMDGMDRGELTLTEGEILLLAKLCRRDRDDDAFLRAIEDAGESIGEIRKRRRALYDATPPEGA